MNRILCGVIALIGMSPSALSLAPPQGQQVAIELVQAWVWPAWGDDSTGAVNDQGQPYKSIQAAIDALSEYVRLAEDPTLEGLVWCMPGIYGPTWSATHGPDASGDVFPIVMKNRVHVRGVSARRCVIRGVNSNDPNFDPVLYSVTYLGDAANNCPLIGSPIYDIEQVLVTYRYADKYSDPEGNDQVYWWAWAAEVAEVLDGFTFQGGDVQVALDSAPTGMTYPLSGRVSNCIFDMRHMLGAATPIEGPEVGLLVSTRFDVYGTVCGYFDRQVHVANNTFILSEFSGGMWGNFAKPGAVGLIDVTATISNVGVPFDGNAAHRGISRLGLQNNLFRTSPENVAGTMAMVGVDSTDCLVRNADAPAGFVPTNAFAPARVGAASGLFTSTQGPTVVVGQAEILSVPSIVLEPMYYEYVENPADPLDDYCSAGGFCAVNPLPLPTPAVVLWNGAQMPVNEHDPGFVGEFLVQPQPNNPVEPDYADWRLLPGSPLIDQGRLWQRNEFANGSIFNDHPHALLSLRKWDGEGWGNVRVHGSQCDIGFDEVHLGVMAGSYANGSNSHNNTTFLNPSATQSQSERRILLPEFVLGLQVVNSTLRVKATERQVALPIPPWTMSAWSQPPVTLASPLVNGQLPAGYQTAYINFAAERWTVAVTGLMVSSNAPAVNVPGNPGWNVIQVPLPMDNEGANFTSHFNTQFVLDGGSFATEIRGNLQPEYR